MGVFLFLTCGGAIVSDGEEFSSFSSGEESGLCECHDVESVWRIELYFYRRGFARRCFCSY